MAAYLWPRIRGRVQQYVQDLPETVTERPALRVALGAPGETVKIGEETLATGRVWREVDPDVVVTTLAVLLEEACAELDATLVAKLNELVGAYNQLLADYNDEEVPSAAPEVDPL